MARLPERDSEDLPAAAQEVFAALERDRGYVPKLYRVAANAPHFLSAFADMVATSRKESALPSRLKELAILEIAKLTGAQTMWLSHVPLARAAGVSEDVIACLPNWQDGAVSAEEQAILSVADEVTGDVRVRDEAWAKAARVMDDEQLAELVFVVAFYNMVARVLEPLKVDVDPRYALPSLTPGPSARLGSGE